MHHFVCAGACRRAAAVALTLVVSASAGAGHYTRILKDIGQFNISSNPRAFAALNGFVYFNAEDGSTGQELWKSNGTPAGTSLVKDIQVGTGSSDATDMTAFGSVVLFRAHGSGGEGDELWRTDGTEGGTFIVKDIDPAGSSLPTLFTVAGSKAYFRADDGTHGNELWVTDGTEGGTQLVKDINATGSSNPGQFAVLGNLLVFQANNGVDGRELWVTDGTGPGTFMINLNGATESRPSEMTTVGAFVYFYANIGVGGLWRTDGTEVGTEEVLWMNTNSLGSVGDITDFGGLVAFTSSAVGGRELWLSDGTGDGTFRVKDIRPGGSSSFPSELTVAGGLLFFNADDGTHGEELWISDGTEEGTVMTRDVAPGAAESYPNTIRAFGNNVIYSGEDPTAGYEVFVSDGTVQGTGLLKDIYTGPDASSADNFTVLGAMVLFSAYSEAYGNELWKTDGTTGGTVLAADINNTPSGSNLGALRAVDGAAYFYADDGTNGNELWTSDGTPEGTVMIRDISPGANGSSPFSFTAFNGAVFFNASGGVNGSELWKTDGTFDGTVEIIDIRPGSNGSSPFNLTVVNNTLVFVANDGTNGSELWYSDGTEGGTEILKNINPAGDADPDALTVFGALGLFAANDGTNGIELWKTDATPGGTVIVQDIHPAGSSTPRFLTALGNIALFAAEDGTNGRELWKTTGAVGNATLVKNIRSGSAGSDPQELVEVNGVVYFSADDGTNGRELWRTVGDSGTTTLVADIFPGSGSSEPEDLTAFGDSVVFVAQPDSIDRELWISDGTEGGTRPIADIREGASGSFPEEIAVVDGRIYFSAIGGPFGVDDGRELWVSDGTEEGTHRVENIAAGDEPSFPQNIIALGERALFAADDGVAGLELWATEDGAPEIASIAATGDVETNDATVPFAVNFDRAVTGVDVTDFAPDTGGKAVSGAAIASVTGSGASYTVSVSTGSGSGSLGLTLIDDDSITGFAAPMLPLSARDGNDATQSSASQYAVDREAPAVTVNSLVTGNDAPQLTGTVNDPDATVVVSVGGQSAPAIVDFDGDWILFSGPISGLAQGTYNVIATATDTAGNAAVDATTNELIVDLTPPTVALLGPAYIMLTLGDTYTEFGAVGQDDRAANVTIDISGDMVNTAVENYYYVQYRAVDDAGNLSNAAIRLVDVANFDGGTSDFINPQTGGILVIPTGPVRNGQLTIPPLALQEETLVRIDYETDPPPIPPGWRLLFAVELTPTGLVLNNNVAQVLLPWYGAPNDDPGFFVAYYDPASGEWLDDGITNVFFMESDKTIRFSLRKLMTYGVFVFSGDVNGDGSVNAVDIQFVINAALGLSVGNVNANVDGDAGNAVNAVDVQIVINQALGNF